MSPKRKQSDLLILPLIPWIVRLRTYHAGGGDHFWDDDGAHALLYLFHGSAAIAVNIHRNDGSLADRSSMICELIECIKNCNRTFQTHETPPQGNC